MTIDDMLGRLFALIHDSEPCTREEYELDAAIRRTLEKVKEWQEYVNRSAFSRDAVIDDIRDFDPGKERQ